MFLRGKVLNKVICPDCTDFQGSTTELLWGINICDTHGDVLWGTGVLSDRDGIEKISKKSPGAEGRTGKRDPFPLRKLLLFTPTT